MQRAILKHEADRMNLQVSDEDLRRELQTGPFAQYLFPNGNTLATTPTSTLCRAPSGPLSRADFESPGEERYGAEPAAGTDHGRRYGLG